VCDVVCCYGWVCVGVALVYVCSDDESVLCELFVDCWVVML